MLTVLFSILFQSVHSYEHFAHDETVSIGHSDDGKTKVQAHDHDHEKCFVCEFTLSSFIATEFTTFQPQISLRVASQINFPKLETPEFFSGSHSSHRGPPSFC